MLARKLFLINITTFAEFTEDHEQYLKQLGEIRDTNSDGYFLTILLENDFRSLSKMYNNYPSGKLITDGLLALQFPPVIIKEFAEQIHQFQHHQTLYYWAKLLTDQITNMNNLLVNYQRFPFLTTLQDEWINKETIEKDLRNNIGQWVNPNMKILNINTLHLDLTQTFALLRRYISQETDHLYHGTSHSAAVSLLERGINIDEGQQSQDFSNLKGFYLTDSLEYATSYAQQVKGRCTGLSDITFGAVLVYHPLEIKEVDRSLGIHGLNLETNINGWKEIVKGNRTGSTNRIEDFIRGPVSSNGREVTEKNLEPEIINEDDPSSLTQTCILSHQLAEILDTQLEYILFL